MRLTDWAIRRALKDGAAGTLWYVDAAGQARPLGAYTPQGLATMGWAVGVAYRLTGARGERSRLAAARGQASELARQVSNMQSNQGQGPGQG